MSSASSSPRILAVYPTSRGFGFVVMEGPATLLDWGTKDARTAKNSKCITAVAALIEQWLPDALVLQDITDREFRRCSRIRELIKSLRVVARRAGIERCSYPRQQIRAVLWSSRAVTKHQIARAVAERLTELADRLPPPRRPWMSQDERMAIFDAAALALVFYRHEQLRKPLGEAA